MSEIPIHERVLELELIRLAEVTHYIIARTDPAQLGATKLNKILWYADIEHYRKTGKTITGQQSYVRLPRGPVPHRIEEALDRLKTEGKVIERPTRVHSYERREFLWVKEPDVAVFTAVQIDLINVTIDAIKDMTAEQISSITHEDDLWKELENGEAMPIGAGSIRPRAPTEQELAWAQSSATA